MHKPIMMTLPWPPSVNHYWLQRGTARFIGPKGKAFRVAVAEECAALGVTAIEGRIAMHVALWPPDKRRRDVDNLLKALLDACEHAGCYADDNQIDELHIVRHEVRRGGQCVVVILPISKPLGETP
jgi:crossover junction endodeoxyribonuclease RusA